MITPPYYEPGPAQVVVNGDAAMSRDARAVDRATTWLATHRWSRPALVGPALVAGSTYTLTTLIPGYTEHVAFAFLVTGTGSVNILGSDDADDTLVAFDISGTTLADAVWLWVNEPKDVAGDGYERALSVTDQSTPHEVTFTLDVSDTAAVWELLIYPLPRTSPLA